MGRHRFSSGCICEMAKIIDGKALAAIVQGEVKAGVLELQRERGITPGLAVVLVGDRKDSQTYVRSKKKAAEEVGYVVHPHRLPCTL